MKNKNMLIGGLVICGVLVVLGYVSQSQPMQALRLPQMAKQTPVALSQNTPLQHYQAWRDSAPENYQNAQAYMTFLTDKVSHKVTNMQQHRPSAVYIPPAHELFYNSHARVKKSCQLPVFHVPPQKKWHQLVPTLVLINQLKHQGILGDIHVTSGYRDSQTNECVGGSRASKHLKNAALDFTIITSSTSVSAKRTTQQLCQFWRNKGRRLQMGLGTYGKGRYHIDTQGFRTWGSNYRRATSLCTTTHKG